MNHVWPSIALRAGCAARPIQRQQPLLQLFSGYARQQSTQCPKHSHRNSNVRSTSIFTHCNSLRESTPRAFSTTAFLAVRGRPSTYQPKSNLKILSDSRLEPPTTVAAHSEGREAAETVEELLTWRDFDPAGGMPLPDGQELDQAQINTIFSGEGVDMETGNYILNVMHWRRMSGALMDSGLDFPPESNVSREQALKGLEYVRSLNPNFDEQAAGQVWVEEESLRLQEQIQERALKLGIYKRDEQEPEPEPEEELQGTAHGRARSGESQLVKMREASEEAWEQEQAERAATAAKAELAAVHSQRGPLELGGGVQPDTQLTTIDGSGISISQPQSKAWLQPVERKPWVKYYEEQAQLIKDNTVPQLSLLRRLGPSFLVLCGVVFLADFLAENYTEPPQSARLWPDQSTVVATLIGVSTMLAVSFVAGRLPPLWRTYSKYFTILPAYPHGLGIVGAMFRHDTVGHLAFNLASLWVFGLILHEEVGRGAYASVFLASGAAGGFASLAYNVVRSNWTTYIFGASGAILGTVGAACVLRPNGTIHLFGREIPISAWIFATVYIVTETFAIFRMRGTGVDHVGHLGGLVAGMAMAGWWKWKARRQRNEGIESNLMREVPSGNVQALSQESKAADVGR